MSRKRKNNISRDQRANIMNAAQIQENKLNHSGEEGSSAKSIKEESVRRKPNWNIILTMISTLAAVISLVGVYQANKLSKEANKIAQESNLLAFMSQNATVSVANVGIVGQYAVPLPCINRNENIQWELYFVPLFDVTNHGGKPISITGVSYTREYLQPYNEVSSVLVHLNFLGSKEKYDQLLNTGATLQIVDPSLAPDGREIDHVKIIPYPQIEAFEDNLEFSGPPIIIGPGETKRIALAGVEEGEIKKGTSVEEASKILSELNWQGKFKFTFSENIEVPFIGFTLPDQVGYVMSRVKSTVDLLDDNFNNNCGSTLQFFDIP